MGLAFSVIDTGLLDGRRNIAIDAALIELHQEGTIGDTLRFLHFPPTALVGRHQAIGHEIKLDYAREHRIGLARRITGGGAIYFDQGQIGWELVLSRQRLRLGMLADYTRAICEAAAHGLSQAFGIEARYRPRNDIEVDGKKISGTGGFFDGDTLFYQGTVLIDVDPARMMAVLNVPRAKLAKRDLDKAEARVTTLGTLLGRTPLVDEVKAAIERGFAEKLGLELTRAPMPGALWDRAGKLHDEEIGTDDFVFSIDAPGGADTLEGECIGPGGTARAFVRLEGAGGARRIREVLIAGDFFVTPPRMVFDLEAHLRGVPVTEAGGAVDAFFATAKPDLLTIAPADFRALIEDALMCEPA